MGCGSSGVGQGLFRGVGFGTMWADFGAIM